MAQGTAWSIPWMAGRTKNRATWRQYGPRRLAKIRYRSWLLPRVGYGPTRTTRRCWMCCETKTAASSRGGPTATRALLGRSSSSA
eukprot:scaffold244_cov372-Pavlova_lutheri.AAC.12